MFSRVGRKIRKIAIIVFVLGVIVSTLCALLILSMVGGWYWLGGMISSGQAMAVDRQLPIAPYLFAGFVWLLGCLISWLSTLKLYAYGQLVDDNELTRKTVEAMNTTLKQVAFKMKNGTVQRESEE